ncbi:MAG: rSAM-associated Gly-rich repeat protein [Reyranella sp.]|nr:rSAM-associated Gly-rich repeat protein [Reyranella sp.]
MTQDRRSLRALAALLPSGILGLSMSLAAADASAATSIGSEPAKGTPESVALRLEAIRNSVSVVVRIPMAGDKEQTSGDDDVQLAWWGNGWRNGGWHNGGWGNGGLIGGVLGGLFGGGWGNGFRNGGWHNGGWGNGGWHNGGWGNGGWHNGWHNW